MASYITVAELESLGGNPDAISDKTNDEKLAACEAASAEADDHLRTRYQVPLAPSSVSGALKKHIAKFAYYELLSVRGFSPDGDDQVIVDGHANAIKYFVKLARGEVVLDIPAPTLATAAPAVYSDESRRW